MERVILRHLKGSKTGVVEEYPLESFVELLLGRDPSSQVRFDPASEDLVGRQHARIGLDPLDVERFVLTDLNSRNGTFLNRLRVVGTMPLQPGDVIQLGAGGPELQFDIDPLPARYVKATRLAVQTPPAAPAPSTPSPAETREVRATANVSDDGRQCRVVRRRVGSGRRSRRRRLERRPRTERDRQGDGGAAHRRHAQAVAPQQHGRDRGGAGGHRRRRGVGAQ